jgi:hypothetical protein
VEKAFTARAHEAEREADQIRDVLRRRDATTHTVPDDLHGAGGPGVPVKTVEE